MMDPLAPIVAKRAAQEKEVRYLKGVLAVFQNVERWLAEFPRVLAAARRDDRTNLNPGEVWQSRFSRYWKPWSKLSGQLGDLAYELDELDVGMQRKFRARYDLVALIRDVTSEKSGTSGYNPNDKKQLSYAFGNSLWRPDPKTGRDNIAYEEHRLEDWHGAATDWAKSAVVLAKKSLRKASR